MKSARFPINNPAKLALLTTVTVTVGCGSVETFKDPITSFQSATTTAEAALESANQTLTSTKSSQLIADLQAEKESDRRKVRIEGCDQDSDRCRIILVKLGTTRHNLFRRHQS